MTNQGLAGKLRTRTFQRAPLEPLKTPPFRCIGVSTPYRLRRDMVPPLANAQGRTDISYICSRLVKCDPSFSAYMVSILVKWHVKVYLKQTIDYIFQQSCKSSSTDKVSSRKAAQVADLYLIRPFLMDSKCPPLTDVTE